MRWMKGFSLIEIIMVIVILGVVSVIGTNIISDMYAKFIRSHSVNDLQQKTELALDQIVKRLQYRIKDSVIAKKAANDFLPLSDDVNASYDILEWMGYDYEGFVGEVNSSGVAQPGWSGFVDLDHTDTNKTQIKTSGSKLEIADDFMNALSNNTVDLSSAGTQRPALIFKCQKDSNLSMFGWQPGVDHNNTLIVQRNGSDILEFIESPYDQMPKDICEQYYLSWSAYALVPEGDADDFNLTLYYNYQPWYNESFDDVSTNRQVLAEHVSTFRFIQIGETVRIKLCIQDDNRTGQNFAFCREKAIF